MVTQVQAGAAAHRRLVQEWIVAGAIGILLALVAGTALRIFVLGAVVVPSRSMRETVVPGDHVLISKLVVPRTVTVHIPFTSLTSTWTIPPLRPLSIGDVVVVHPPPGWFEETRERKAYLVKRCAGMAGDTLAFDRDVLTVNGRVFLLPSTAAQRTRPRVYHEGGRADTIVVPAGEIFLLGDDPGESVDSRVMGTVPVSSVVGVAAVIYWSVGLPAGGTEVRHVQWERIGRVVR